MKSQPKTIGAGKGDRPRPKNQKKWDEGYDRIFKTKKLNKNIIKS